MKFLLDFFPIVVFVGIYVFYPSETPMYPAVIGLMVATIIQNIGTKLLTGQFEKLHVWTLIITLAMGGLTLLFRDPAFIFWKASVLVWVTAMVFLYRQHIIGKVLLQEMLSKTMDEPIAAPESLWKQLNHLWAFSYILFGFLNLWVAYNFAEATWVQFKLFGLLALNFALLIYIMTKIYPYLPAEEESDEASDLEVEKQNKD
jgi:intracellular septation protein